MAGNVVLIESFSEFKEFKNIDRHTMMRVLEDVFKTLLRKKYGNDENFDIIVNPDKGDLEIWRRREIVADGEVQDSNQQVAYSEATKIEADFEVGEELYEPIGLDTFGRRAILAASQTLKSRIMELEKDELYKKYSDRVGDVINGEVYQVWKKELLVLDDDGSELVLPKIEHIPADFYKKGDPIKAIVKKVELRNNTPRVILSRTDNSFLAKLLEAEVPEIAEGLIAIRKIAREPGEKAKVAVESFDERIDPVGSCVGMKGSRILGIVKELRNENIDVIQYTSNVRLFIQRALAISKVVSIDINEDRKRASVVLNPDQISLAIGKNGVNIRLAGKLTGYEIDVYRDSEEEEYDIELDEFSDEIDQWVIDQFKAIGCDTARSVLSLNLDELVRRTDLEEETVRDVLRVIEEEFDSDEEEEGNNKEN
ncbi:MAG: transcription termination/antitermination protein NusA [Chitinophagales bacterium]|jgi:N utilization substance protein A|nr:transcription termination/antitermination protein NusA [Chitinophagales bacterium]